MAASPPDLTADVPATSLRIRDSWSESSDRSENPPAPLAVPADWSGGRFAWARAGVGVMFTAPVAGTSLSGRPMAAIEDLIRQIADPRPPRAGRRPSASDKEHPMARRTTGNMNGERYLANTSPSKREVHDPGNEKTGANQCQIDEIIRAGNDQPFIGELGANADGYDNCAWCIGGSKR